MNRNILLPLCRGRDCELSNTWRNKLHAANLNNRENSVSRQKIVGEFLYLLFLSLDFAGPSLSQDTGYPDKIFVVCFSDFT